MERNEITAEIDIMELDHEEILIRREEGALESRLQMLNTATIKVFLDSIMEFGDDAFDDDFAISLASFYGRNLLMSLQKVVEWHSKATHTANKKKMYHSTLDFLRAFIDGTEHRYEPKEPIKK